MTRSALPGKLATLAGVFFALLAASAIGSYSFIAASRMAYPFTLEWVEANSFIHVVRVMQGQPLYVAPSYDFIPMIYTPLYFYVAAPLAMLSGQVMLAMRFVSLMASLASLALIYAIGRARRLAPATSLLAAGLFAAGYGLMGFWLDLGRVDSLFLAWLLAAYWLTMIRASRDRLFGLAAGLALWLSFATKQTAIIAFPFLCLFLSLERRWAKLIACGLSFSIALAANLVIANTLSKGWFWFYTFQVPGSASLLPVLFTVAWKVYLLPNLYPVLVLIGLALVAAGFKRRRSPLGRYGLLVGCLTVPLVSMTLLTMSKTFGYVNDLIPAMAGLALAGAEAAHWLLQANASRRWVSGLLTLSTLALVGLQFVQLRYALRPQIPTAADWQTGEALVDLLRHSPTPITSPLAPYLMYLAGQPIQYELSSMGDLSAAARNNPAIAARLDPYLQALVERSKERLNGTVLLPENAYTDFYRQGPYACRNLAAEGLSPRLFTGAQARVARLCIYTGH